MECFDLIFDFLTVLSFPLYPIFVLWCDNRFGKSSFLIYHFFVHTCQSNSNEVSKKLLFVSIILILIVEEKMI